MKVKTTDGRTLSLGTCKGNVMPAHIQKMMLAQPDEYKEIFIDDSVYHAWTNKDKNVYTYIIVNMDALYVRTEDLGKITKLSILKPAEKEMKESRVKKLKEVQDSESVAEEAKYKEPVKMIELEDGNKITAAKTPRKPRPSELKKKAEREAAKAAQQK